MLFTVFQWIWLILIVLGAVLVVLRPIALRRDKTRPLTERSRAWLWFLQSFGFWAIVIGTWMRLESVVQSIFDEDEDEAAETAQGDDARK